MGEGRGREAKQREVKQREVKQREEKRVARPEEGLITVHPVPCPCDQPSLISGAKTNISLRGVFYLFGGEGGIRTLDKFHPILP